MGSRYHFIVDIGRFSAVAFLSIPRTAVRIACHFARNLKALIRSKSKV